MKIELRNISFRYQNKLSPILKEISITFEGGKIYLLSGINGAGKTTLGKLILGLLKPIEGEILFDGQDVKKTSASDRAKKIGYIFQNPDLQLFAPTVYEELTFPYQITNTFTKEIQDRIDDTLKTLKIEDYKERSPLTLSVGEKQKLALATVLVRDVDFLILDEPSSALDNKAVEFLITFLKEFAKKGGGVIIISHDSNTLAYLSEATKITLVKGKIEMEKRV